MNPTPFPDHDTQNKQFHFLFQAVHHVRKKKVESASLKLQKKINRSSQAVLALIAKHQHPHLAVLAPTRKATLAQPGASDRPGVTGEIPLALSRALIPYFHHAVFSS